MRITFAMLLAVALIGASAWGGEEAKGNGHYSGPMDIEGHSAARVNDGSEATPITLEDLDQKTVHNVLRQATRPEAVELVREMTIEQGGVYVGEEATMKRKAANANAATQKAPAAQTKPAARPAPRPSTKEVKPVVEETKAAVEEEVQEAAEQVQGGIQSTTVSLQEAIDQLDRKANPKLFRGPGPQMPPQK